MSGGGADGGWLVSRFADAGSGLTRWTGDKNPQAMQSMLNDCTVPADRPLDRHHHLLDRTYARSQTTEDVRMRARIPRGRALSIQFAKSEGQRCGLGLLGCAPAVTMLSRWEFDTPANYMVQEAEHGTPLRWRCCELSGGEGATPGAQPNRCAPAQVGRQLGSGLSAQRAARPSQPPSASPTPWPAAHTHSSNGVSA